MRYLERLKSHWFSLTIIGLFLLAGAWPSLGRFLNPQERTKIAAIVVIFFLSGLGLRAREAMRGLVGWRVHLFIQGFCFVFFPLACWIVLMPWQDRIPEGLLIGFYLLAVLPTTITSCVVFTRLAGGNFAAALFNAVLGNMAGIFLSPALLLLLLGSSPLEVEVDAAAVFLKLSLLVLAPLAAGQAVRRLARERAAAFGKWNSLVNRWCILAIVYFAFCQVFLDRSVRWSAPGLLLPLALLLPAHLALLWLAHAGARLAGFDRADRIAVLFCAPQKTLALGLPLVAAVLEQRPDLAGLAYLPIIVYHPIQLLAAGFLEERFSKNTSGNYNSDRLEVSDSDCGAPGVRAERSAQ